MKLIARLPSRAIATFVLLAWAVFGVGCSESDSPSRGPDALPRAPTHAAAKPSGPPNFVLLVADTLRADRVAGEGHEPGDTPTLDRLRRRGTYFSNALSTSSWTLPATVSLFTSQLPSRHGVAKWASRLGDDLTLLPGVLSAAGYRTGGWSANRLITRERGFKRGFDEFQLVYHPKWKGGMPPDSPYAFAEGSDLTRKAMAWLDEGGDAADRKPFFLYLHFMEPHTPFLCPPSAGAECTKAERTINRSVLSMVWTFDAAQKQLIERFYDSDVRRLDRAVGELLAALDERGLLDDTWILFTADHGEMLGEHGLYLHGRALFEETVQIPLLVVPPNGRQRLVETPVSIVDLAPTIVEAAGIPRPPAFEGASLVPALNGAPLPDRPLAMELMVVADEPDPRQRHLAAVRSRDKKVFLTIDDEVRVVDLAADPAEMHPEPARPGDIERLLAAAGSALLAEAAGTAESPELSPEMREHLKGLGYLRE